MKKRQRLMLTELMTICNDIGSQLDGTATNNVKYIDRQRAHMLVSEILYGVLCDEPENEYQEHDLKNAQKSLEKLKQLQAVVYPDRNGLISQFQF